MSQGIPWHVKREVRRLAARGDWSAVAIAPLPEDPAVRRRRDPLSAALSRAPAVESIAPAPAAEAGPAPPRSLPVHPGSAGYQGDAAPGSRRLSGDGLRGCLALDPAGIRDLAVRMQPLRKPRNGTGNLSRPRTPAEQSRLCPRPEPEPVDEWGYRDRRDDTGTAEVSALAAPSPPAIVAPELPAAEAPDPPPAPPPRPQADPGEWGPHYGTTYLRGGRHPRAVLDEARAAEMRSLAEDRARARSWPGCSGAARDRQSRAGRQGLYRPPAR